jgi:hypothetical protein
MFRRTKIRILKTIRQNHLNKFFMKKLLLAAILFTISLYSAIGQNVKFNKSEQAQIQAILGNDFRAVLGKQGQLGIVTPQSVANIKSTKRGGFSKLGNPAANAIAAAYEKAWVYKQSTKELLLSRLGQEKFQQLSNIMQQKGITIQ